MKSALKFLFLAFATVFLVKCIESGNAMIATGGSLLFIAMITGYVIPNRFHNSGQLNVITDMKVWNKYIVEKLRKVNDYLRYTSDESSSVLGGAVVYIPQAGSDPTILINDFNYPDVAVVRTDSDVNYALDYYRTKPNFVPWSEIQTISYDKIDSVVKGHTNALAEKVGDVIVTKWAPNLDTSKVFTTGGDITLVGSQTGTRRGFEPSDLKSAMIRMNVANIPKKGRVCLIDDNMYEYFYDQLTASQMNAYNQFADNANGVVGRLHGFDIITRSSVLQYPSGTNQACEAAGSTLDAGDKLASICWHPDMVASAVGEAKAFQDKDNPLYYGDIWSFILRCGGRAKRADGLGVIAIVQDGEA